MRLRISLWVERVSTHDNIADNPSRESHELLQGLNATWLEPHLATAFRRPSEWESICIEGATNQKNTKKREKIY